MPNLYQQLSADKRLTPLKTHVGGLISYLAIQHDYSSRLRVLTYSNIPMESRSSTGS